MGAIDEGDHYHASAYDLVRGVSGHSLAALDLTLYEVANAMLRRLRRTDPQVGVAVVSDAVHAVLLACDDRPLLIDTELIAAAAQLSLDYNFTAYDAAYVAAAHRHGCALVSVDVADLVSRELAVTPDSIAPVS
jgi:predicted nucleic acid-binding protein